MLIEHPRECEAIEGCINEAQGICFKCGGNFCSMHAGFAAHGCLEQAFSRLGTSTPGATIECEECATLGEYLCVGCNLFLCEHHYRDHPCDGARFEIREG